ncbi:hypothetical protein NEMIN01_2455 [Nematocida minor]|uniref:uncharacterized protein n=1 Tax=Nematocida minor TaxID=1912983 RepID=UPI00221FE4D0|nr:uncharacterized protein NEMIN01_2455 [Nematocida minor]KAI5193295.1 hypothetical protein NEMIN01_2455 [Nematocida minor]
MKLKIPLSSIKESLVIRLPKSALEKNEPPKVSLNKIVEDKMQFLLNAIYAVCIDDIKEQEKRRRIIRLYTKETNELVKILTLLLASKHAPKIDHLESKILKLQQYNKEQEELADLLVYKCNDLKLEASSSYDITRSVDVLLHGQVNFPTEILALAKSLTKKDSTPKNFERVDQLLNLHVQKSGIWTDENTSYSIKDGVLELDSYGYKSTLIMTKKDNEYVWHVLSMKQLDDDTKSINIKGIVFKNTIKEIVNMTKYASSVVQIEEIYRIFKNKIESKIFDMELSGTSKNFTVSILGMYKAQISIANRWDGPNIVCHVQHSSTSAIFKENIINSLFLHIETSLKKEFTSNTHISLEKGLFYRDRPMHTLRELQKEVAVEKNTQKTVIPKVISKTKVNVMCNGSILQLNIVMRTRSDLFIGVYWNASQTAVRLFYGIFQMNSLLVANEMPIIHLAPGSKPLSSLSSPSDECVSSQVHSNRSSPSDELSPLYGSAEPSLAQSQITIETFYRPKQIIHTIFEKAKHFLAVISSYNTVKALKGANARIFLDKHIELHLFNSVLLKLEGLGKNKIHSTITSSKVSIEDKLSVSEIEKLVWISVITEGIACNKHIFLPDFYKRITVEGKLANNQASAEMTFAQEKIEFTLSYSKGRIECLSQHPLVSVWVASVINEKSKQGLSNIFLYQDVLVYPGLVSTLHLHNTLGGSLKHTCQSSIMYTIKKFIDVYWKDSSDRISSAFKHIPKIRETATDATISLQYLQIFLETISRLLSEERIQQMGGRVRIGSGKAHSEYLLEMKDNKLVCEKVEGKIIKNAEIILERCPDPEKELLEHNFHFLPNGL